MQNRQILTIGAVIAVTLAVIGIIFATSLATRSSKTAVDVIVYPKDSTITINDQAGASGVNYLEPGEYTFKANKQGWSEASQTVTIGTEQTSVTLLPSPETAEAMKWLNSNNADVYERESVAGRVANEEGLKLHNDNPIIDQLPYKAPNFEITYNETSASSTGVEVLVIAATPAERTAALKQIRDWGYDPSTMQIKYIGFSNPLGETAQ